MEQIGFYSEGVKLVGNLWPAGDPAAKVVVFCHGAFEFQDNWFEYAERLSTEGVSAFTFDFCGHGESEGQRSLVSLRVWAHNIRDALNALGEHGYREFALVGWGVGGSAALLAAVHDRRLACAVLLSTPVYLAPNLGERVAYGLVSVAARLKKALLKRPLTLSRLNELEVLRVAKDDDANNLLLSNPKWRAAYQAIPILESLDSVWFDITHTVRRIEIPVLVIHAGEDGIIPVDQSEKLIDALQGRKQLKVVDGCGHALHLDCEKDAVYRLIARWVKKYLRPPRSDHSNNR
jgi:alpha-beta hydrolase superfamily lysophospholipase